MSEETPEIICGRCFAHIGGRIASRTVRWSICRECKILEGMTPFGRWLVKRGDFIRGFVYGFALPVYLAIGALHGAADAMDEWRSDRATLRRNAEALTEASR